MVSGNISSFTVRLNFQESYETGNVRLRVRGMNSRCLLLFTLGLSACAAQPVPCAKTPELAAIETETDRSESGAAASRLPEPMGAHNQGDSDGRPLNHSEPIQVTPHAGIRTFEMNGNQLRGLATSAHGAKSYEVWRSSVAVGSHTPPHRHDSEEVFIFLKGKGRAVIGGETIEFEAPATVVAPAGVPHQFFNIGDVPTDAIVVVGIGSEIYNAEGKVMDLPWRR